MDLNKSLRIAVDSGKAEFGTKSTKTHALNGTGKLVIIAENCKTEEKNDLVHFCKMSKLAYLLFDGTSMDLGVVCGKPFAVSAMTVLEAGDSDVLDAPQIQR